MAIGSANLVGVALAHGLVIVVFIYAYGHTSGTHINPAVTLGLLIAGEIEFVAAIGYWVVQFLGGILGALPLNILLPDPGDLGVTILAEGVTPVQGLVIEIVLTKKRLARLRASLFQHNTHCRRGLQPRLLSLRCGCNRDFSRLGGFRFRNGQR